MEAPNRLSIEQVKWAWGRAYADKSPDASILKQLLDTMHENERLHDALRHIAMNCMGREAEAFAKNILHSKLPEFANYRYKDSDNG